jgi:hypothetical protein
LGLTSSDTGWAGTGIYFESSFFYDLPSFHGILVATGGVNLPMFPGNGETALLAGLVGRIGQYGGVLQIGAPSSLFSPFERPIVRKEAGNAFDGCLEINAGTCYVASARFERDGAGVAIDVGPETSGAYGAGGEVTLDGTNVEIVGTGSPAHGIAVHGGAQVRLIDAGALSISGFAVGTELAVYERNDGALVEQDDLANIGVSDPLPRPATADSRWGVIRVLRN